MAKLYFRYGAMNSGKSTALIQVAHNYEERGMKVCVVKPATDDKIADSIHTRIGATRKVDILATESTDLFAKVSKRCDCVLVDEAQFLTRAQVDQLFRLTHERNIPVIAYGIRTDFQTNLFPGSERLFALAHAIEELKTICRCGKKAMMNARKVAGEFVGTGSQVAIDKGDVSYESLCPSCYAAELAG